MPTRVKISVFVLAVILALGTLYVKPFWANPQTHPLYRASSWWTQGFLRAMLTWLVTAWLLVLGTFAAMLAEGKVISADVAVWLFLAAFGTFIVGLSVALFSWPSFLIPPSLRRRSTARR